MKRVVVGILPALFILTLAACTPPLGDGAYMELPDAQANKVTANVGEPVEVTVTGGFGITDNYYLEKHVQPGVSLGACLSYASDVATEGGLCPGGERPLPDGMNMVDGTTVSKDFGDITMERGEHREIEHTFTFTSDRPVEIVIVSAYLFSYEEDIDPGYEPGGLNIVRVSFE